ncbi:hypothetical protein FBQ82_14395 [Anaerolineae bacterium CFX7]|nr:hypothetical protein [Anaerolineae bacterium CFX7]
MKKLGLALFLCLGFALVNNSPLDAAIDVSQALTWSVQYMIDQSQTVMGGSQFDGPRGNRGLALSPDGNFLYAGYNGGSTAQPKQVRKIDLSKSDYTDATVAILKGNRGKALAADDKGRVYMAEGSDTDTTDGPGIHIYNAGLTTKLFDLPVGATYGLTKPEGVAATRESGALVLYVTDRTTDSLYRFALTEGVGDAISGASLSGLGGSGVLAITGASDLRGVEVAPDGKIWMADVGADRVFRLNADGTGLTFTSVTDPLDVAFDDTQAFATQLGRTITVLKQNDLSLVSTLTPPWSSLKLDSDDAYLAGIVVKNNTQIFVTNEDGQTENEQSTYGRCDDQSDNPGGPCTITDLTHDDNEPILSVKNTKPNAVTLGTFKASARPRAVALRWDTGTEINLVGFRVWRAQDKRVARNLTPELIPAQQAGQINGAMYRWRDARVQRGKTYVYQIEAVHADGTSEWSHAQRITLP